MEAGYESSEGDNGHRWHRLQSQELVVLHVISLVVGIISGTAVTISSYWFVRMRRSFRHDLIMLLIQTDLFKSIWFITYPIVEFAQGPVSSDSTFCQISGFFLTAAIEACDVVIVLIALHTMLHIVRGDNGLFPYRKFALGIFFVLPLFLTSLAFIDRPAFTNSGEFCYLPNKANWTGRALSWIPRYVIFVTLIFSYTSIYVYVSFILDRSGAAGTGRSESFSTRACSRRRGRRTSLPPTPPIAYHGLIPSTPVSQDQTPSPEERRSSSWTVPLFDRRWRKAAAHLPLPPQGMAGAGSQSVKWHFPSFGLDSANSSGDPGFSGRQAYSQPRRRSVPSMSPASTRGFLCRSIATTGPPSRAPSLPNIRAILRQGPNVDDTDSSASFFLSTTALGETGMEEKRDKVRQNTRQLFVYPLVYLAVWLFPLLTHILGGEDEGAPFAIVAIGILSMCLHGACDAFVFCWKEQPWRHVKATSEDEPFSIWTSGSSAGVSPNVGRTQEEMLLDRKIAIKRRDEEAAELRLGILLGPGSSSDWWDRMQAAAESSEGCDLQRSVP